MDNDSAYEAATYLAFFYAIWCAPNWEETNDYIGESLRSRRVFGADRPDEDYRPLIALSQTESTFRVFRHALLSEGFMEGSA